MRRLVTCGAAVSVLVLLLGAAGIFRTGVHAAVPPFAGQTRPAPPGRETAVLAGGCFWGVDAVFKHVRGVLQVVSGYAGGTAETAGYEAVSTGTTGHAESVEVTFDPSQITYAQLLQIFFAVVHDPTEVDRQGPDMGPQYRSAIFYASPDQQATARAYVEQLTSRKVFPAPIATQIVPLQGFYPAEPYHQDFLARHPDHPYIVFHDLPKLQALQREFPAIYKP